MIFHFKNLKKGKTGFHDKVIQNICQRLIKLMPKQCGEVIKNIFIFIHNIHNNLVYSINYV